MTSYFAEPKQWCWECYDESSCLFKECK